MKFRLNIIVVSVLLTTLALVLATALYLARARQEGYALVRLEQAKALRLLQASLRARGGGLAVVAGQLRQGDFLVNGSTGPTDRVQQVFGGVASIFQGDVRIATSLRGADGRRLVGSRLEGPAREAVIDRRQRYTGKALIGGEPYLTAYEPLYDRDGHWVGALAVGIREQTFAAAFHGLRQDVMLGAAATEGILILLSIAALRQYRRQERRVQESEEKYRTLFENSTEGVFLFNGAYVDCNRQAARLFGCDREQILGRTPLDFSPERQPDGILSAAAARDLVRAATEATEPHVFSWQHRRQDGTLIDTEVGLQAISIGGRRLFQAIVRDVTERLRAERLLAASEHRYRQLFSQMLNAFALFEVLEDAAGEIDDFRFLDVNQAFERFAGRRREDLVGTTLRATYPDLEPSWLREFAWAVTSGTPTHLEDYSQSQGRWLEMNCFVPAPGRLAVAVADITLRKTAETRLQEVLYILSELREENFFADLVSGVGQLFDCELVLVGELVPGDTPRIRTRAVFVRGESTPDFDYPLPFAASCWDQGREGLCCLPYTAVQHLFPAPLDADQWQAGVSCLPLRDAAGEVSGIMAGFKRQDAAARETFQAFLRLFSLRAAEELQRQQREQELETMSSQIRLVIDSVPVAIAYVDGELRYQFANSHYQALFGLADVPVVGRTIAEVLGPAYGDGLEKRLAQVVAGEERTFVTERPGPDGRVRVLQSTYVLNRDESGALVGIFVQHYDTTDLLQAQRALQQSEEHYRTLFETTGTATLLVEEDGSICLANSEFERLTQRSLAELQAMRSFDLFDAESRERIHRYHYARLEDPDSAPTSYECTLLRKDGSFRHLQAHVGMIPGTRRRIASYHDITPLRQLKDSLENQLSFLEVLLNTIPNPIFYKDRAGRYLGCNQAFESYLGLKREEIVGRSVYELAPKELADIYHEKDEELFRDPGIQIYESSVRGPEEVRRDVAFFKATFSNPQGDIGGLVGMILDVTELKRSQEALQESEERFHQLFSQNEDAILILRADGTAILDANPAASALLGYDRDQLLALAPAVLTQPQDFEVLLGHLEEAGDQPGVFFFDKVPGVRRDGSTFSAALRGKFIRLQNERVIYCSIRDISEKLALEAQIRRTQAKLIHANKMTSLGMLTSSVAHEINNPNSYIAVNAATLADIWKDALPILQRFQEDNGDFQLAGLPFSELEQLAPRLFRAIIEGSARIAAIIGNMKDFVRDNPERRRQVVDLNGVAQQAATILWHHIHKHTDDFSTELEEDLPAAMGDRQQLEQVVINLIMNALQALPGRERQVSVATFRDGDWLVLQVRDQGKGMSPEVLERLTEPFFTTRMEEGGTGLGLYISSSIIRDHGGEIRFESNPDQGTTVSLRLPLAAVAD